MIYNFSNLTGAEKYIKAELKGMQRKVFFEQWKIVIMQKLYKLTAVPFIIEWIVIVLCDATPSSSTFLY